MMSERSHLRRQDAFPAQRWSDHLRANRSTGEARFREVLLVEGRDVRLPYQVERLGVRVSLRSEAQTGCHGSGLATAALAVNRCAVQVTRSTEAGRDDR